MMLYVSSGDIADSLNTSKQAVSKFFVIAGTPPGVAESIPSRRSNWPEKGYPIEVAVTFLRQHAKKFTLGAEHRLRALARPPRELS